MTYLCRPLLIVFLLLPHHCLGAEEPQILVGATQFLPFRQDLPPGTAIYIDADPAAGSILRATQRCLGYREVEYKALLFSTLFYAPVLPSTNAGVVTFDYTAQTNKTNLVGFLVNKDIPVMVGPDGRAYIPDGHHNTAGYLLPSDPFREIIPGRNRVIFGHIVANFYDPEAGPKPVDDTWWLDRAAVNNALLYGPEGGLLTLPGEPNYSALAPILPSVLPMPTTPSSLTTNGAIAMSPNIYRGLSWGINDAVVLSATDAAGKKLSGYKKSAPGSSADIYFVDFFWGDYLRHRVVWNDALSGSPLDSGKGDANAVSAPLGFFTAVANGIALARSELYRDEYGRHLIDYTNTALFSSNTVFWAQASLSNGLAAPSSTFNLYLRDDSTISGEITPSALSTNILHVDTATALTVTQELKYFATVLVNAGGSLKTSWKDSTIPNSTLRLPAGTGVVNFNGILEGGSMSVANGTLAGHGTINGALTIQPHATFIPVQAGETLRVNGPLTLAGNTVMHLAKNGSVLSSDTMSGITTLAYEGTLTLSHSGDALAIGDTFQLFDAAGFSGFFYEGLNLPPLPAGLGWDTSRLTSDGTLKVVPLSGNLPPQILLTAPTNSTFSAPGRFALQATASDPENSLAKLEIFEGATKLARAANSSLSLMLTGVSAGVHRYVAVGTDHYGLAATSIEISVTVTSSNVPPGITLDSPLDGAVFSAPATIPLTVTVNDPDDDIARVDYYSGATLIASSTRAPFAVSAANFPVGTWALKAVATDANGATNQSPTATIQVRRAGSPAPLVLQILHASDFDAGIDALEDAARFSQVLSGLAADYPQNTLRLSSGGNYIPGTFFNASGDPAASWGGVAGRADIAILNALGIEASAFGNHEFDINSAQIRSLLVADPAIPYAGSAFPYLSANLDFKKDSNLAGLVTGDAQDTIALTNKIAKSATITVAGQTIGLVGATTPDLRLIALPGAVAVDTNVLTAVQNSVDDLLARGINKIIVLSHLNDVTAEFALARKLHDVDVIIAGGSEAVSAKSSDRLRAGDRAISDYPETFATATGEPVLVVNTGPNYRYVGRLIVQFDTNGVVSGLGAASGAYATDPQGVLDTGNFPANPAIVSILNKLAGIIDSKDAVRYGRTTQYLNGLSDSVRTEETNLGDLTTDALLWRARQSDPTAVISLKNAGGIRGSIGAEATVGGVELRFPPRANPRVGKEAGEISQLDIENSLRFNNALSLITLTARQLRDTLEWGVAATAPDATPAQFPQLSGLSFSFDPTADPMTYFRDSNNIPIRIESPGSRLRSLVVTNFDGTLDLVVEAGVIVGNAGRTFRVVTLDFLANGGDSYYALTLGANRVDLVPSNVTTRTIATDGTEQHALAHYLAALGVVTSPDTPIPFDNRIQNLSAREDTVTAPLFTQIRPSNQGARVFFFTLPGKNYRLESRTTLSDPWSDSGLRALGDGHIQTLDDPAVIAPTRFYRLVRTN